MTNKVYKYLEPIGVPLDHNFRPDMDRDHTMVMSYHFFGEGGLQFGDGAITEYGGSLQVDLFVKHRVDFSHAKKRIKEVLTNKGFTLVDITTTGESVDGVGKVDHIKFTFNYIELEDHSNEQKH